MKVLCKSITPIGEILENMTLVNNKYYHIPFWFEKTKKGLFILHHVETLPDELKESIKEIKYKY